MDWNTQINHLTKGGKELFTGIGYFEFSFLTLTKEKLFQMIQTEWIFPSE